MEGWDTDQHGEKEKKKEQKKKKEEVDGTFLCFVGIKFSKLKIPKKKTRSSKISSFELDIIIVNNHSYPTELSRGLGDTTKYGPLKTKCYYYLYISYLLLHCAKTQLFIFNLAVRFLKSVNHFLYLILVEQAAILAIFAIQGQNQQRRM